MNKQEVFACYSISGKAFFDFTTNQIELIENRSGEFVPPYFDKIGDAMRTCSEINAKLGTATFKVQKLYI